MQNNEIQRFLESIRATDNFANSCKQLATNVSYKDEKGKTVTYPRIIKFAKNTEISTLSAFRLRKCNDYYVSKNSFFANKRKGEYLFSLDNIVIDLDNHAEKGQAALGFAELDYEIDRLLYILDNDYKSVFPQFNVVRTGRGVQLWIGLQSCSSKLNWLYQAVTRSLCDKLKQICEDEQILLDVDYTASVDATRLVRVPCTYNQHRKGFKTSFEQYTDYRYDLNELVEEQFAMLPIRERERKRKRNDPAQAKAVTSIDKEKRLETTAYTQLHRKRCAFIASLIYSKAENIGRRDKMLFLWYNAAVQIMDREKAAERLERLNNALSEPLTDGEIGEIIKYIDNCKAKYSADTGFFPIKNSTFLDWLDLSTEERLRYCTESREIERRNARNKRVSQDNEIKRLWSHGLTQAQIAEQVGCSVRTVQSKTKVDKTYRNSQIVQYHAEGKSLREIAILCRCSVNTVRSVLRKELPESTVQAERTEQNKQSRTVESATDTVKAERSRSVALPSPSRNKKRKYSTAKISCFDTLNRNNINQRGKWENGGRTHLHYPRDS